MTVPWSYYGCYGCGLAMLWLLWLWLGHVMAVMAVARPCYGCYGCGLAMLWLSWLWLGQGQDLSCDVCVRGRSVETQGTYCVWQGGRLKWTHGQGYDNISAKGCRALKACFSCFNLWHQAAFVSFLRSVKSQDSAEVANNTGDSEAGTDGKGGTDQEEDE